VQVLQEGCSTPGRLQNVCEIAAEFMSARTASFGRIVGDPDVLKAILMAELRGVCVLRNQLVFHNDQEALNTLGCSTTQQRIKDLTWGHLEGMMLSLGTSTEELHVGQVDTSSNSYP
jgi:hypothetical protein